MNFGKNMRLVRNECNLTQSELAQKVGVTSSMINRIESDTKMPSLSLSLEIAKILNTTVDKLAHSDNPL